MRCIQCGGKTTILDSREALTNKRRRRECSACNFRFTTYETTQKPVVKKSKLSLALPKKKSNKKLSAEQFRQKRNLYNRRYREKKRREEGIPQRKSKSNEAGII